MKELPVDRLQIGEIILVTVVTVATEELEQYVLSIDEVLPRTVCIFPVVDFTQDVKILHHRVDNRRDVREGLSRHHRVYEIDILVLLGHALLLEETEDHALGDSRIALQSRCIRSSVEERMELETLIEGFIYVRWDRHILRSLILPYAFSEMSSSVI